MTTLRPWGTQDDAAVTLGTRHLLHYGPPDVDGGHPGQGRVAPRADQRGGRPAISLIQVASSAEYVVGVSRVDMGSHLLPAELLPLNLTNWTG